MRAAAPNDPMERAARLFRKVWSYEPARAALILFFVLDVAFFPCMWGNKTFLASARDAASVMPYGAWEGKHRTPRFPKTLDEGVPGYMTEPWFKLIGKQYVHEKNPPLWNPYQAYGMPLAANMESQPFYPLTALLSLHLTPRTYNWYILLRLFVAGFGMYLFLRFFVSFLPAIGGGVAAMLAGYYIFFITMQQTSVEVILPGALLAGEWLLRKADFLSVVYFSLAIWLVMVGGMPESAFLLLVFLYGYVVTRVLFDPGLRRGWMRRGIHLAAASIAGLLLSAILLLPFYEFLPLSFDMHQPGNVGGAISGLAYDRFDSSLVSYLFPLLFGPAANSEFAGMRNYFGVIGLFLGIVSVAALWTRRGRDRHLAFLTIFSTASIILVLLKRYGFTPVNAIGALPLFRLITFTKYEELIISAAAAILCAIGLERIARQHINVKQAISLLIATFVIVLCGFLWAFPHARAGITTSRIFTHLSNWSIGVAAFVLFALAGTLSEFARRRKTERAGWSRRLAAWVCVLLTVEFLFSYIAPSYYIFNFLPTVASNPYEGAPFVTVLEKATADHNRVFCRDGVLFPDWSSAFSLPDVRAVGAMYYKKYFDFLHAFLPVPPDATDGELSNRFNGGGDYYNFKDPLSRRLLQVSSVKYIGSAHPYTYPNPRVEEILRQNAGHLIPGKANQIARQEIVLDGEARAALGEHPPYERLPYQLTVNGSGDDIFYFSFGLHPFVFEKAVGDGVGFTIELKEKAGEIKPLFSRYIDPKHNPAQRHWIRGALDLSPWRGQQVTLLFSTDPGPKGDASYDWAAWSDFHFGGEPRPQPFRLMYGGEAQVYAYDNVLPRAAMYTHADLVDSPKQVLTRLAQPSLDVFKDVVLARATLDREEISSIEDMNSLSPAAPVSAASIRRYESQRVDIDAVSNRPAVLVLNDSDYPGWTVEMDGRPARWFSANYLFRGVLLPRGKHSVTFRYRPRSFLLGSYLALTGLAGLIAWGLIDQRLRRSRNAGYSGTFSAQNPNSSSHSAF